MCAKKTLVVVSSRCIIGEAQAECRIWHSAHSHTYEVEVWLTFVAAMWKKPANERNGVLKAKLGISRQL